MKPIIVLVKNKDEKIELTKEELEKIVKDAYDEGYEDGQEASNKGTITYPSYPYPYTPSTPNTPITPPITCCNVNVSGEVTKSFCKAVSVNDLKENK